MFAWNSSTGQFEQLEAPEMLEYIPDVHDMQLVELVSAKLPAKQLEQVVEIVAPATAEYIPAGQLMQVDDPESATYLPAVQELQLVEPIEAAKDPAEQEIQLADRILLWIVPEAHLVHMMFALEDEYVPGEQLVQSIVAS